MFTLMSVQMVLKKTQFTTGGRVVLLSFLFTLFSVSAVYSQSRYIKITNSQSGKETVFEEGKRIRVKTVDRGKISGIFSIIDSETILIRGVKVKLSDIAKIKSHPLGLTVATSSLVLIPTLLSVWVNNVFIMLWVIYFSPLIAPASVGLNYVVFHTPNILKGFRANKGWHYDIIMQEDIDF